MAGKEGYARQKRSSKRGEASRRVRRGEPMRRVRMGEARQMARRLHGEEGLATDGGQGHARWIAVAGDGAWLLPNTPGAA